MSYWRKDKSSAWTFGCHYQIAWERFTITPKNKDHQLTGNFAGYRECHISPDWLLICKKDTAIRLITLIRLYAQGHTQNCSNNPIQAKIHIIPALHPGTAGVFSCLRRWNGFCNFTSINQPKNKEGKIMTTHRWISSSNVAEYPKRKSLKKPWNGSLTTISTCSRLKNSKNTKV